MYKIAVEQLLVSSPEIFKWCLDFPLNEGEVSLSDLETDGVLFQGWVLPFKLTMPSPFVRVGGQTRYFDLTVNRPDVVQRVLLQDAADHPLGQCGFRFGIPYQKHIRYDNHLPNFGRVIIIVNQVALFPGKCLIFGSSSSYSTLPYFSRIFTELVLVHSAGNIDVDLVRHEAPHYVIVQTNGRFVIRPPMVGYSLKAAIAEKLAALPESERKEVLRKAGEWLKKGDTDQIRFYHDML